MRNANFGSSCFYPEAPCSIEKYDTLLGDGWVIVKFTYDPNNPYYQAYNLNNFTTDGDRIYPEDGEAKIFTVSDLETLDDGVFGLNGSSISGLYNLDGKSGSFGDNASIGTPFSWGIYKNNVYENWNGGGTSAGAATVGELGIDGLVPEDFYFSEDQEVKKDLENLASAIETEELTRYGLSTRTAKLVKTLAKTSGKRALTAREKDLFSKELLGLSFEKAAEMIVEDYEGLIEKAAELNETSPEAIKDLLNSIL